MRTAKEIAQEPHGSWQPHDDCSCECECCGPEWQAKYEAWIKSIQFDALKEGMSKAADIVSSYHHNVTVPQVRALFAKTILTARDNLKLEDLK